MEPDSPSLRLRLLRQVLELPDGRLSESDRWLAAWRNRYCQNAKEVSSHRTPNWGDDILDSSLPVR